MRIAPSGSPMVGGASVDVTDLVEVAEACVAGNLAEMDIRWRQGAAVSVVLASQIQPAAKRKTDNILVHDGNEIVLNVTSSLLENNKANEGGSAVFFVSNDKSGSITIKDSITRNNPKGTFETPGLPGFYVIAKDPAADRFINRGREENSGWEAELLLTHGENFRFTGKDYSRSLDALRQEEFDIEQALFGAAAHLLFIAPGVIPEAQRPAGDDSCETMKTGSMSPRP